MFIPGPGESQDKSDYGRVGDALWRVLCAGGGVNGRDDGCGDDGCCTGGDGSADEGDGCGDVMLWQFGVVMLLGCGNFGLW